MSKDDRMTLKGTVRITDEIVAAKDREIAELHRRIKAMAAQVSKAASPADALAEVLDVDAVIAEERQRLHGCRKSCASSRPSQRGTGGGAGQNRAGPGRTG